MEAEDEAEKPKEQIRIWMDGAFDMMHYGHMNAFRQAKSLGTYLVVGVNDDASITACKGAPPVMNDGTFIESFNMFHTNQLCQTSVLHQLLAANLLMKSNRIVHIL